MRKRWLTVVHCSRRFGGWILGKAGLLAPTPSALSERKAIDCAHLPLEAAGGRGPRERLAMGWDGMGALLAYCLRVTYFSVSLVLPCRTLKAPWVVYHRTRILHWLQLQSCSQNCPKIPPRLSQDCPKVPSRFQSIGGSGQMSPRALSGERRTGSESQRKMLAGPHVP